MYYFQLPRRPNSAMQALQSPQYFCSQLLVNTGHEPTNDDSPHTAGLKVHSQRIPNKKAAIIEFDHRSFFESLK